MFSGLSLSQVSDKSLEGKVILVTGANIGIGKETARYVAAKGARTLFCCRSEDKALAAIADLERETPATKGRMEFVGLDLGDLEAVKATVDKVHTLTDKIDVLFANAGVMIPPFGTTKQGFETQFGVNHVGHFALVLGVLDLLAAAPAARVVVTSSEGHQMGGADKPEAWDMEYVAAPTEDKYNKGREYGISKLANIYFAHTLNERCKASPAHANITAYSVHPGVVATNLVQHAPGPLRLLSSAIGAVLYRSPEQGAVTQLTAGLNDEAVKYGGTYWCGGGPTERRSAASRDTKKADDLWRRSLEWTGLTDPTA